VARPAARSAIDLARVVEAEAAAKRGDSLKVLDLLGSWPAPLAIFLRTPEGQLLNAEARATIARGLGLLGSACIHIGEHGKGEEVLRLGIQYAGDGVAAPELFLRLGEAMLKDGRPGEAIAPLRRAANLGTVPPSVWALLAEAFLSRGRNLAALGAVLEARAAGTPAAELGASIERVKEALGKPFEEWQRAVGKAAVLD
jgi:tetratricopeptide (TPR) repeat protein